MRARTTTPITIQIHIEELDDEVVAFVVVVFATVVVVFAVVVVTAVVVGAPVGVMGAEGDDATDCPVCVSEMTWKV
jgi:hypothetical protein